MNTNSKTMVSVLCAVLLAATAAPALARELAGVALPERVEVADKTLILNGMGVREATILNVKVYVAGLYLESKSSDAKQVIASRQTKRLVLHFVRAVTRDQIVEAWNDGFEDNAGKAAAALRPRLQKLAGWMRDLRAGDTLSFTYVPDTGVTVAIGATSKGTIAGDDFARTLFAIFVGPEPPNESLKTGLLGKS